MDKDEKRISQETARSRLLELVERTLGPQEGGWSIRDMDRVADIINRVTGRVEWPTRGWEKKAWTGKYLWNLIKGYGYYVMSQEFMDAVEESLEGQLPQTHVGIRSRHPIPEGTLIIAEPRSCQGPGCSVTFIPAAHNQKYHSLRCKRAARRERDRIRNES